MFKLPTIVGSVSCRNMSEEHAVDELLTAGE
jgi:hypothetical protein